MIEEVNSEVEIENLYKTGSHAPYRKLPKGKFGYYGAMVLNKTTGKIQCHICGSWYFGLATHARFSHGYSANEYREEFGFESVYVLVAPSTSEKFHKATMKPERMKLFLERTRTNRGRRNSKYTRKKISATRLKNRVTASRLNTNDLCDDQIRRRIAVVQTLLGKFPYSTDLVKYDHNVLWEIKHRYGTFNKFKKIFYPKEKIWLHKESMSKDYLQFMLREFKRIHGRVPAAKEMRHPSYETYVRTFGSWNKALTLVGMQPVGVGQNQVQKLSKDFLQSELLKFRVMHGRSPKAAEIKSPSYRTYVKYFGSWNKVLESVGMKHNLKKAS